MKLNETSLDNGAYFEIEKELEIKVKVNGTFPDLGPYFEIGKESRNKK